MLPLRKRKWFRVLVIVAGTHLLCMIVLAIVTRVIEDGFIYHPRRDGDWGAPARSGLAVEEVTLTAADGVKLHGWYVETPGAKLTVLYFHGNAGNVARRWWWTRELAALPANVFAVDYRGYGRSEGEPSERGIYLDAEAAYRHLVDLREVDPARLVVYGKSLGGAPACEIAARFPCGAVILQSTFTNIPDMSNIAVWPLPAGWFVATQFDNLAKVARIEAPKLFVHSRADEVVPYRMSERLHEAAAEPKRLVTFETGSHMGLVSNRGGELLDAYREFLESAGLAP